MTDAPGLQRDAEGPNIADVYLHDGETTVTCRAADAQGAADPLAAMAARTSWNPGDPARKLPLARHLPQHQGPAHRAMFNTKATKIIPNGCAR